MIIETESEYEDTLARLNGMKRAFEASGATDDGNLQFIRFLEQKVIDHSKLTRIWG